MLMVRLMIGLQPDYDVGVLSRDPYNVIVNGFFGKRLTYIVHDSNWSTGWALAPLIG